MGKKVLIPQDITEIGKKILIDNGYKVVIGSGFDEGTICRECTDCDAIIIRTAKYTRRILESAKNVKILARYGIGVDNVDMEAANELGIWVTNSPRSSSNAVAEHTMLLMLACARNLGFYFKEYKENHNYASRGKKKGTELLGKTLAIIGLGRIGRTVAKKAYYGFDMKVIAYDPFVKAEDMPEEIKLINSLDEILPQADFVTLHMPLLPETNHMVNKDFLSKMKKTAILLNIARGAIVEELDLIQALKDGIIAGAGIDVLEKEPPAVDNPLFAMDNVIITPHNASMTKDAMDIMGEDAAQSIMEVMSGNKPKWKVNNPENPRIVN